ncbi:MAG TPA: MFS transporter [Methanocella sp.]|uniref:MFS transporter n=1 Tax=Methanocella sp. TaxID=2052833 RepID=UPI002C029888|nr:MFS transporter [Methanocella sp.]HTY90199.1 MFS transporter [Methanocella sp.]
MDILKEYMRTIRGFHRNVKLLLLRSFIICLYTGIYGILFNLYILNLGYGADFLGLVLSAHVLASSAMSIPAGILCDRFDKKKLMVVAGMCSTLAAVPLYVIPSAWSLLLFSIVGGIFVSISSVVLTPMLAENCTKEDTVHVFSANSSISWIASILGCAMGGIVPGMLGTFAGVKADSLRLTLLSAVVLLAMGLVVTLMIEERKGAPKSRCALFSLKSLKLSPDVLKFALTSLTFGAASGMIVPYFNVYFTQSLHMSVLDVGLISAVAGVIMIGGFIITPYLTLKIGKIRAACASKLIAAPLLMLMAFAQSVLLAAGAYVAYMFFINMAGPATTSFQMEQIRREEQGFAVGMMMTGNYIAVSLSTYVSGLLIAGGNYLLPFIGTCTFYLITAALLYYYFKDVEQRPLRLSTPIPRAAYTAIVDLE